MEFGKLEHIEHVDFKLPEDNPFNSKILTAKGNVNPSKTLYIGCTGWSTKEWVGSVYPKGAKAKDFLSHYGKQFNTIELNATHYKIPDKETIKQWIADTPNDFRFCPKFPQTISHSRDLGLSGSLLPIFCDTLLLLEARLGCTFLQLPPYFSVDRLPILQAFLAAVAPRIPVALELRHESWFHDQAAFAALLEICAFHQASLVITDVAGRRDVLHAAVTTTTTMIRFVGNGLHPTDYLRVQDWVKRLTQWYEAGLETAYFFTHEPDNLLAPQLANYLHQQALPLPLHTRGPRFATETEENQMKLF